MVFCAEGYQVVLNDTSTLTCAYNQWDKSLCLIFGVDFSECFFAGRLSECTQQEASISQAVVSLLHFGGKSGEEVEGPSVAERTSKPKLDPSDRHPLTQRAVTCLRCSTCERMSRTSSHRPSRIPTDGKRFNEELFVDVCDLVDVRGNRYA